MMGILYVDREYKELYYRYHYDSHGLCYNI